MRRFCVGKKEYGDGRGQWRKRAKETTQLVETDW